MATVGVIAVLMAIAALGLDRRHADLETAHQEFVNAVRELRLRATVKGAHYRLAPAATSYAIERLQDGDGDGAWEADPASPPRVVQLPPGVQIDLSSFDAETPIEFDTRGVLVATGGVAADVVRIVLTDHRDERRAVEVWPSGQVQGRSIVGNQQ